ncbi:hypothetical protein K6Y31_06695 [Motilimonas cestriensis]|uniref:Uncharacterized protein n=1 Tax=Motilimonas cestriensis TaxID=2742685 RepID=A0ABS8W9V3_9GAMM|nr:hypothetical protein [Motilimonas cestriensis]MCE2594498.1 hypothetical protein [Motilimonas cestriensis]
MSLQMKLGVHISLLRRGAELEKLSLTITALAVVLLMCHGFLILAQWQLILLLALVLLGLVAKMYALRVSLDADLFAQLARLLQSQNATTDQGAATDQAIEPLLRELDSELAALSLIKAPQQTRALLPRCQGALRLLQRQLLCVLLQLLLLLGLLLSQALPL